MTELNGVGVLLNNADKIGVVAVSLLLVLAFLREWLLPGRSVRRNLERVEAEAEARIAREQKLADERVAREQAYAAERLAREREITEQVRKSNDDILAANREIVRQQDQVLAGMDLVVDLVRSLPNPSPREVPQQREQAGG